MSRKQRNVLHHLYIYIVNTSKRAEQLIVNCFRNNIKILKYVIRLSKIYHDNNKIDFVWDIKNPKGNKRIQKGIGSHVQEKIIFSDNTSLCSDMKISSQLSVYELVSGDDPNLMTIVDGHAPLRE